MGVLDKIRGLVGGNRDKAKEGVDKTADIVDDKTGGKRSDQIEGAADKAKDAIDKIGD